MKKKIQSTVYILFVLVTFFALINAFKSYENPLSVYENPLVWLALIGFVSVLILKEVVNVMAITKAKELLNWEPKVSRQEGLKLTYDFFKSLSKQELSEVDHYNFDKFIK